jgi:molybdate transport system substrate-binding protein
MNNLAMRKKCDPNLCSWRLTVPVNLILYLCIAFIFLLPLKAIAASANEITVSAAASLTDVFKDITKSFEAGKKDVKVHLNFASSGNLMRQIIAGAPVDVFASAAVREMDELDRKQLLIDGTRHNFAENGIVLIKQASSNVNLKAFNDLKNPDIKKIAIGNPATVPAGMYAQQTLKYVKLWDEIKNKLVYCEHVRQVLDYAARGEVDAGIVFSTDAGVRAKDVAAVMTAPEGSHNKALYPIAIVKDAKNEVTAKMFVDFVLSREGRKILDKYGFKSVK